MRLMKTTHVMLLQDLSAEFFCCCEADQAAETLGSLLFDECCDTSASTRSSASQSGPAPGARGAAGPVVPEPNTITVHRCEYRRFPHQVTVKSASFSSCTWVIRVLERPSAPQVFFVDKRLSAYRCQKKTLLSGDQSRDICSCCDMP